MTPTDRFRTRIAPVDHAARASMLQLDRSVRLTNAVLGAARGLLEKPDPSAFEDCWALGDAALRRLERLQRGWVASWFDWLDYAAQIGAASTLSKLGERELNVVNQAVQLASEQSVQLLTLAENLEVDVLRWMADRAAPPLQTAVATAPEREAIAAE